MRSRYGASEGTRLAPDRADRTERTARPVGLDGSDRILFPAGAPPRPSPREVPYERMSMDWAISVLMGHRDLARRLASERGLAG